MDENQEAAFKTLKTSEYCWIEIIKLKMTEILTNKGCLWGWQGSLSLTSSSRTLRRNGNSPNFNDFRLPLGEVGVLLLLSTSPSPHLRNLSWLKHCCVRVGDRPPSHWWWRNCQKLIENFFSCGNTTNIWRTFLEVIEINKIIYESGLFWREFHPHGSSRKPSRSKVRTLLTWIQYTASHI